MKRVGNEVNNLIFTVEWSQDKNFGSIAGFSEITDLHKLEVVIRGLKTGINYFVRVSAGNSKGFSCPCLSSPISATPSSKLLFYNCF